jgi:hypothetical protein
MYCKSETRLHRFLSTANMSLLLLACAIAALSGLLPSPLFGVLSSENQSCSSDALDVDLGYAIYRGFANTTTDINTWRG